MREIIVGLCLLIAINVQAVVTPSNLGNIRQEIRYSILDSTATSQNLRYTDAFLNYRINTVQREIVRAALPLYTSTLIAAVTGQAEYTVPSDIAKIDKVVFQITSTTNSYQKMTCSTIQSLDNDKGPLWEQLLPGQPTNYYAKNNVIGLVPAPAGRFAISTAIKIYYYQDASDLSSDSDIPFNGVYSLQDYSVLIVLGVSIKCKREKGVAWQDDQTMYNAIMAQLKADVNSNRPDNSIVTVNR